MYEGPEGCWAKGLRVAQGNGQRVQIANECSNLKSNDIFLFKKVIKKTNTKTYPTSGYKNILVTVAFVNRYPPCSLLLRRSWITTGSVMISPTTK